MGPVALLLVFAPSGAAGDLALGLEPAGPALDLGPAESSPLYFGLECPLGGCDPTQVSFGEYAPPQEASPQSTPAAPAPVWDLPAAAHAVAIAGLLGLLAWSAASWGKPVLARSATAWPLFSRLERPALLKHPVRARILELVRQQPGLHFQEIARRLGLAQGVALHHLHALVAAEILVKQVGPRYSLFFLKGAVDRRLMNAAPMLRAPGAQDVLAKLAQSSGTTTRELVSALGLAPSTVKFHLRRFVEGGLASALLDGRRARFEATSLGQAALQSLAVLAPPRRHRERPSHASFAEGAWNCFRSQAHPA